MNLTYSWHAFLQVLLVGLQSGNAFLGILPVKYQGLATLLLASLQAGLGFAAINIQPPQLPPSSPTPMPTVHN
jgi:hypothetical protein